MPHISKYFKLPTLRLLDPTVGSHGWLKHKGIFLGKRIITLPPTTHIKLDAAVHARSHRFSLMSSSLLFFIHRSLHHTSFHCSMVGETDQTSLIVGDAAASGSKAVTSMKSNTTAASSSANASM
jgi:hypothetical protein